MDGNILLPEGKIAIFTLPVSLSIQGFMMGVFCLTISSEKDIMYS